MSEPFKSRRWGEVGNVLFLAGFPLIVASIIAGVVIAVRGGYVDWGNGFFSKPTVSHTILASVGFRVTLVIAIIALISCEAGRYISRWNEGRSVRSLLVGMAVAIGLLAVVGLIDVAQKMRTSYYFAGLSPDEQAEFLDEQSLRHALDRAWSEPPQPKLREAGNLFEKQWKEQGKAYLKLGRRIPPFINMDDLKPALLHMVQAAKSSWGAQDETLLGLEKVYLANGSNLIYLAALVQYVVDEAPAGWVANQIPDAVATIQANLGTVFNKKK